MSYEQDQFATLFQQLTGHPPYPWQSALFARMTGDKLPDALDIPTGLGKTSVMTIWLLARLFNPKLPRRLVYIVDRRAVVDQATEEAIKLAAKLKADSELSDALGIEGALPISTLRGQFADNRKWSENPAHPAIVVGTVDMTGSRLLFSGYRLSWKQWPVHAGLLAYDSLIVLDEAHLNEPFRGLLGDVTGLTGEQPGLPQPSKVMSLSATGAATPDSAPLTLGDADNAHPRVQALLTAPKPLTILAPDGKLPDQLAEAAWALAKPEDGPARRVLVFCNSRDDAGKTAEALRKKLAEHGKPEKKDYTKSHLNLLVGERRVHERQSLREDDLYKLFLGQPAPDGFDTIPAFLVATSAGEVGIDLDAQAMACDLVAWERMVQRLGRVNRKGHATPAPIVVIDTPDTQNPDRQQACRTLFDALPEVDDARDASVGAIRALKATHADDIAHASTAFPLRPKLTRPILEGWSLTSLQEEHTGSPDITPWLRGWVDDDDPQCEVFWRAHIPWRGDDDQPDSKVIAAWLDAAPPHLSEMLEAPVWRVVDVLKKQFKNAPLVHDALQTRCVLLLDKRGKVVNQWTHAAFSDLLGDSRKFGRFKDDLVGHRLLLQADIGGLGSYGLLEETDAAAVTLDTSEDWAAELGLEFTHSSDAVAARATSEFQFLMSGLDDEKAGILAVHRLPGKDDANENTAISRNAQTLDAHQRWAANTARMMARQLNLPDDLLRMLYTAVAHHDAGKAHPEWQSSMGADKNAVYAKTTGVGARRTTNGYRHELGSLLVPEVQAALAALPEDLRDLAWHLIAAHHGHARPYINPFIPRATGTPFHLLPEKMPGHALEVALRFARLQKAWGPWGLAWWEAVFRAADARASMWNDQREDLTAEQLAQLEAAE